MIKNLLLATTASLALASGAASAFSNTSFESGLSGWTSVGTVSTVSIFNFSDGVYSATVNPISGSSMALLTTGGTAPEILLQSAAFTPSTQPLVLWYRFMTEDYAPFNDSLTLQYKTLGGSITTINTLNVANSDPDSGWKSFILPVNTVYFKAQLQNQGDGVLASYAMLDIAPVPEPESYAMLLAGLGLMGTIARRRKTK
jgi:hypothetical protein